MSLDTAVVQTQAGEQGGTALQCASASGSGATYTCSLNPTLDSYTSGMVLHWVPDHNGTGGATTLNVDTLGAVAVKLPDGLSNPTSSSIVAGEMYAIWHDGTVFRLPVAGGSGGGTWGSITGTLSSQTDLASASWREAGDDHGGAGDVAEFRRGRAAQRRHRRGHGGGGQR